MGQLNQFEHLDIDWGMTPEEAVTLYLEWGNNSWHGRRPPVRSSTDYSNYFVVNTWEREPKVFLIRRNSEEAVELACLDLPDGLREEFLESIGHLKGVYAINDAIKGWLERQIYN